jgi:hypothetical protein
MTPKIKLMCVAFLGLSFAATSQAQVPVVTPAPVKGCNPEYPSCPPTIENQVQLALGQIPGPNSRNGELSQLKISDALANLGAVWLKLVFYTVADAVAPPSSDNTIHALKPIFARGETARTDKQTAAAPSSSGSTELVEKAGLTTFLAYAVENGAIQENVSGTTATLTGSPYGLVNLTPGGDTPENYARYSSWRRINFSTTFNLANQDQPLQSVNTKQLSAYSIRLGLYGDRSTRSKQFFGVWDSVYRL